MDGQTFTYYRYELSESNPTSIKDPLEMFYGSFWKMKDSNNTKDKWEMKIVTTLPHSYEGL